MTVVKVLGTILLAIYLIFAGLLALLGISVPHVAMAALGLVGIGAGVLLLISLGSGHKE